MFSRCDQLVLWCDAPPYAVVRACKGCGFHSPLDVRWCHMSRFLKGVGPYRSIPCFRLWRWLFGQSKPKQRSCTCGQPLADLSWYEISFFSEKTDDILLGQCRRCQTIFWDAACPVPAWMKEGVFGG
jgi:hypothetical protein